MNALVQTPKSQDSAREIDGLDREIVWKTEGPTDMLAVYSLEIPEGHMAVCNVFGAGENPAPSDGSKQFILEFFRGKIVYVCHDCDLAGQDGATRCEKGANGALKLGWAPAIATVAAEVRNVVLPYEITPSHGKDLRDYAKDRIEFHKSHGLSDSLARRATYQDLLDLAAKSPIIANPSPEGSMIVAQLPPEEIEGQLEGVQGDEDHEDTEEEVQFVLEAVDDPHRLARVNLELYRGSVGRELRYWKGSFYIWKTTHYIQAETEYIKSRLNQSIKQEFDRAWQSETEAYEEWKKSDKYDESRDKGPPVCRRVTTHLVNNVLEATKSMVTIPGSVDMPCWLENRSNPHLLGMQNGLLDLGTLVYQISQGVDPTKIVDELLLEHSPNWFSTVSLNYEYVPNAHCEKWTSYIEMAMEGDEERIAVLQEWAGYLLTATDDMQKFLCLEGDGGNGKTVFLAGLEAMIGSKNVSHVPLECFSRPFDLASTIGKVANIVGDIGEIDAVAEGVLKRYTGGDAMHFDRKGIGAIDIRPSAKLMFAWNNRPNFRDRTDGVWRRMILVPFEFKVPKDQRVTGMDRPEWWIEQGEAPGILNWAIGGLYRLRVNREFTMSMKCLAAVDDYRREANPAGEFIDESLEFSNFEAEQFWNSSEDIYAAYVDWSRKLGMYPLGSVKFFKELKKKFPNARKTRARDGIGRKYGYEGVKFLS